jgi:cell division septation protein DedD
LKRILGIASCMVGLGVIYFGFGISHDSTQKDTKAGVKPSPDEQRQRPVRSMNLALGNMVFFSHDLGFTVKTAKDTAYDGTKIALRIENQLQDLRELYRHESAKNPSLVGGMMLQFNIGPSGEVAQVKEVSTLITDAEFKKVIISEVSKWSFAELVTEQLVVQCPLLFVREGMDITTLVQWEKALGHFNATEKPTATRAAANTPTPAKLQTKQPPEPASTGGTGHKPIAAPSQKTTETTSAKEESKIYQIKYPTSLRKDPNFSSNSLTTFTIGTKVSLINRRGDWLEVKATDNGVSGYIRKEFVTPADIAHK